MLNPQSRRIAREKRTLRAMMAIYCRAHHAAHGGAAQDGVAVANDKAANDRLCPQCNELLQYAFCRLDRCPFGAEKTACARCPIHCYLPVMRSQIKTVMRYAGPRMLYRHPILALLHQVDNLRGPRPRSVHPTKSTSTQESKRATAKDHPN